MIVKSHIVARDLGVDPVTFQVVVSRLSGIVQEMQDSIFRTGYSTIVRESQDAGCLILDASGDVIGEHVVVPLHVPCLPEAVRAVRAEFGVDIHEGDAFITNDPYLGAVPHSGDMAVVTPVIAGGEIIAFIGNVAHKSDLGGVVAGTGNVAARDVFQEGTSYPPVRLVSRGVLDPDLVSILRANSRTPDLVMGDLLGQVGVARLGERRIHEMVARYGLANVKRVFFSIQDVAEQRTRAALAEWPDGVFEAESFVEDDGVELGRRIRYHVRVEKRGERINFDFRGTDDQAAGPVNIVPSTARGCLYFALIGMLDPSLPNNGGLARVVEAQFRKGSVLDPRYPAPCNTYMNSAMAVTEAAISALSGFAPDRQHAGNGGGGASVIAGKRGDATPFVQYELIASAYGGLAHRDGPSACHVLVAAGKTLPVEIMETEYPTRMRRFELIRDSGGAGTFRGGLSPRRSYEILTASAQWTLRAGRHTARPAGKAGGKPGGIGSAVITSHGAVARSQPGRFSALALERGDIVTLEKAGGGGFGDPRLRPFERVLDDVLDGYVSRTTAIDDYQVDAGRLDGALAQWAHLS